MKFNQLKTLIHNFFGNIGLYEKVSIETELEKLEEEFFEVLDAFKNGDEEEQQMELGDLFIVAINICKMKGFEPEMCIEASYNKLVTKNYRFENNKIVRDKN